MAYLMIGWFFAGVLFAAIIISGFITVSVDAAARKDSINLQASYVQMARSLIGNLEHVSHSLNRSLKNELTRYNTKTRQWRRNDG